MGRPAVFCLCKLVVADAPPTCVFEPNGSSDDSACRLQASSPFGLESGSSPVDDDSPAHVTELAERVDAHRVGRRQGGMTSAALGLLDLEGSQHSQHIKGNSAPQAPHVVAWHPHVRGSGWKDSTSFANRCEDVGDEQTAPR